MAKEERAQLSQYAWMPSRIPARDALSRFVPEGSGPDPLIAEAEKPVGCSRWYPVEGGHRVLILYEGQPYDPKMFSIERGVWDHEHCDSCGERIGPMELCYVTEPDEPYFLLCAACFAKEVSSRQSST